MSLNIVTKSENDILETQWQCTTVTITNSYDKHDTCDTQHRTAAWEGCWLHQPLTSHQ